MKTNNPFIDNMFDAQTKAVNNWMDTSKKFQEAISGGNIQNEAPSIYKEWLEKQMNIFSGSQTNENHEGTNNQNAVKPEEFFKSWYNFQNEQIKQMTEFNQKFYGGYMNFGGSGAEQFNDWTKINGSWTNVYTNWVNALNSTYDVMMKNMPNQDSKETFKKFFEGNKSYIQLKDFWSNVYKSWQNQELNNNYFNNFAFTDAYKGVSEKIFSQFFQSGDMKEFFDASMKNMNNYFSGNSDLYKQYTTAFQNMANEYPQLLSGDFSKLSDLFNQMKNVFEKSFAPVLNMMAPGKDKQKIENTIKLMDHVALYAVKQAQFQQLFYKTSHKSTEMVTRHVTEKFNSATTTESQSFNEFYNEWLKLNEAEFTKLYSSEEFSKLKSDMISISSDVKSLFEHQFQEYFSVYPLVFRSEMEELHKTIYDLKKQVKALEAKLNSESSEEKSGKKK
ncbi:MAG: poly(R)-hydroxyalkanoic acid synthase subunit PhaE [Bacteroidota bacterium]|jgi:polyhydroxyalkanoate synthesis regulator phasin